MIIPAILLIIVIIVLIVSIRMFKELSIKDESPVVPASPVSGAVNKLASSLAIPIDNTSVSLMSRPDLSVKRSVPLVMPEPLTAAASESVQKQPDLSDLILKCEKLEQMMAEKNKEIDALKKDLEVERTIHGEFEPLRRTLQEQIEELKTQNKKSREDLQVIIRENVELKNALIQKPKPVVEEYIRAEVDTKPDIVLDNAVQKDLPLRDIFNKNNIKKEGEV